jgi:sugar (pentulose or hexulose) kinase
MRSGWTIVLDIGKTHSKATLWTEEACCIAQRAYSNRRIASGQHFTLDVVGIERWLVTVLSEYATLGPITAIVPVAHGAGFALIGRGSLQCEPLDYEWQGLERERGVYEKQRDPFNLTGSPPLPAGLNLGMQLHWLESLKSADLRSGRIVPWAQYWSWLLSGVEASEVTSLGCHTDLWRPYERRPSDLAIRRGWADRLAPLASAGQVLGTLEPSWAAHTGLSRKVEIYCGLHDSNAALLDARSHSMLRSGDLTVLSTGTWFVAMRSAGTGTVEAPPLPEHRDCLLNVDVTGAPIPSSRFMGGREIEMLSGAPAQIDTSITSEEQRRSLISAVESFEMILPPGVRGVGPFPNARTSGQRSFDTTQPIARAHLYAALLADVSLDLIGSRDTILIEGRFSAAPMFVQALASLRPTDKILIKDDQDGVAHGALRLTNRSSVPDAPLTLTQPLDIDLRRYKESWRDAAASA